MNIFHHLSTSSFVVDTCGHGFLFRLWGWEGSGENNNLSVGDMSVRVSFLVEYKGAG